MATKESVKKAYQLAKDQYKSLKVDTDTALEKMKEVTISLHCWQSDDVGGFETPDAELSGGGIQATGNYPGKATDNSPAATGHRESKNPCPRKAAAEPSCYLR